MVLRLKFCERQWPGRGDPSIQELFPADAVASPRQKKKKKSGKMHFSFSGRWPFVSRRIYSSSYLLLRCPFSTQKRGVLWFLERIQVWAMPNLARAPGKFPLVLSGLVLWAVWGHRQLKNNQSFPGVGGGGGGWESATWLLVSWSTGCL